MKTEIVHTEEHGKNGLALIDVAGGVWLTFSRPWWDLASWLWWALTPGKKEWVQTRNADGSRTRVRAVRIAEKHVRGIRP